MALNGMYKFEDQEQYRCGGGQNDVIAGRDQPSEGAALQRLTRHLN